MGSTLIQVPANIPVLPGSRFDGQKFIPDNHTISRMLRTAQGGVAEYDVTYPGVLVEPAATNYLLNTATPATQTTGILPAGTYTLWIEGAGSAAVTAGTATIADNGTASAGSPNTFTVSVAGTVTVTVTDPVTFFQLERGAFPTSKIPTTTAAVTRAADNVTFATPSWLRAHPNDFAVILRVMPGMNTTDNPGLWTLLRCYSDADNYLFIRQASTGKIGEVVKKVGDLWVSITCAETGTKDKALDLVFYQSSAAGMGVSVRVYGESSWGAWKAFVVKTADTDKIPLANLSSIWEYGVNAPFKYPMTRILRIPTNLSAAALQAWLIAKAGA